jgi:SAM-dependent methyltransferase
MTPEFAGSQTRVTSFLQSRALLQLGPPLVICLFFARRPIRFGLGVGAILWAGSFVNRLHENVLDENRNFFGIVRVISPEERDLFGRLKSPEPADFHFMVHGNIVHGAQLFRPVPSRVPLAYFYPTGPVGQVFAEFRGAKKKPHVAVIGLGAGTLASYGEPGQEMTFYEINPAVVAMAENPRLFTYMRDCQAKVQVVLGDARLRLQEAPDEQFGLIVLDAFSSDAIPVHLLTKEAFELYLSKLAPDGILVMQMTNRYLDLAPLAGRLAQEFHMVCLEQEDENREGTERGKAASHWAVIARREADLGHLAQSPRWKPIETSVAEVWTDDFSNLLGILKWK